MLACHHLHLTNGKAKHKAGMSDRVSANSQLRPELRLRMTNASADPRADSVASALSQLSVYGLRSSVKKLQHAIALLCEVSSLQLCSCL